MMNYYRAYSMEYGTFVGLAWSAAFLSYVYGVRGEALLLMVCMACCGVAVALPFVLGARLNRRMTADGAGMTYWQALLFSFSMMMYACLLHGIVVYGYFELLDGGALVAKITDMMESADMRGMYEQMGMGEQYRQVTELIGEIDTLGSLDKAMLMFNNDFMLSLFLSFLVAVPVCWKRKDLSNEH